MLTKLWYRPAVWRTFYATAASIIMQRIPNKGSNCRIHGPIVLRNPDQLKLGNHVRIGTGCYFCCMGGLTIGDNTQISRNVTIYTGNHDMDGEAIPYSDNYVCKPVVIGNSVWVGMNVCITPGVTIGDGSVIGLGTVVSKDVPAGAVVVSSTQRVITNRDMDKFQRLEAEQKYFGKLWPDM